MSKVIFYLAVLFSVGISQSHFGWEAVTLSSDGKGVTKDVGRDEFNAAFAECPVVQYTRNGVVHSVYKRVSAIPYGFDAYDLFTTTWTQEDNVLHEDFEIYSNYEDLSMNQNIWLFCNYDDLDVGYPRDCGKVGWEPHMWFSFPGGRTNAMGLKNGAGFAIHQPSNCPVQVSILKNLISRGQLRKNYKVIDIEVRANYEVSFILNPQKVTSSWGNILHITNHVGGGNYHEMGNRIPGVWFHGKTTKLHICAGCDGVSNKCLNPPESLPIGKHTQVTIRVNGGFFTAQYDSREVARSICTSPYEPSKGELATVYASDPWYQSAHAVVQDLVYSLPTEGFIVSNLPKHHEIVATVKALRDYELSFTVHPLGTKVGWTQILYIASEDAMHGKPLYGKPGYRIPGIYFHVASTKMHICTACGSNPNRCLNPSVSLPLHKDTRVTVRVHSDSFTAHFNGKQVAEASCINPYKPNGQNAKLYTYYSLSNADVKDVSYTAPKLCSDCNCRSKGQEECWVSPATGCCATDCMAGDWKPESSSNTCERSPHFTIFNDCTWTSEGCKDSINDRKFTKEGRNAKEGEIAFQAVVHSEKFMCSGSLIAGRWVLTAANCFSDYYDRKRKLPVWVGLGNVNMTSPQKKINVARIIRHPKYNKHTPGHDIALLELESDVKGIDVVHLPKIDTIIKVGQIYRSSGWGFVAAWPWGIQSDSSFGMWPGRIHSQILKVIEPEVSNFEECTKKYTANTGWAPNKDAHICAESGSQSYCDEDSGSPLVMMRKDGSPVLIGVTSIGDASCSSRFPTVYTNVKHYVEWIVNNMRYATVAGKSCPDGYSSKVDCDLFRVETGAKINYESCTVDSGNYLYTSKGSGGDRGVCKKHD